MIHTKVKQKTTTARISSDFSNSTKVRVLKGYERIEMPVANFAEMRQNINDSLDFFCFFFVSRQKRK